MDVFSPAGKGDSDYICACYGCCALIYCSKKRPTQWERKQSFIPPESFHLFESNKLKTWLKTAPLSSCNRIYVLRLHNLFKFLRLYQRTPLGPCKASSHLIPVRWELLQVLLLHVVKSTTNFHRHFYPAHIWWEVILEDTARHQSKKSKLHFGVHGFQFLCRPSWVFWVY